MNDKEQYLKLLREEVKPVKIGNKNKTGECGMCGISVKKLYPQKVGKVGFMICENCKQIMDM
jgi:transcription elongation factor Elf1